MLETKQYCYSQAFSSTSLLYTRMGDSQGFSIPGFGSAVGAGTTTVTASGGTPFDPIQGNATTGDILLFTNPSTSGWLIRRCTAKASGASITIDSSIPSGTYAWRFYPLRSGTTVNDGWHYSNNWSRFSVAISLTAQPATSFDYTVEGLTSGPGSAAYLIQSATSISTVSAVKADFTTAALFVRVGGKITGAGTDVATISIIGEPRGR
jgi:hypothetical protein